MVDPGREVQEARRGRRLLATLLGALVVLIVALALESVDVPGAAWVAMGALVVVLLIRYLIPWA